MNTYFELIDTLKDEILSIPLVNSCTNGEIDDVDLIKQTIFPLVHIEVVSANPANNAVDFDLAIIIMDVVDISKTEITDRWIGNDNEQWVLNTTFTIGMRIYESLRRGDLWDKKLELQNFSMDKFTERFENYLSGWSAQVTIRVKNDMSIC